MTMDERSARGPLTQVEVWAIRETWFNMVSGSKFGTNSDSPKPTWKVCPTPSGFAQPVRNCTKPIGAVAVWAVASPHSIARVELWHVPT